MRSSYLSRMLIIIVTFSLMSVPLPALAQKSDQVYCASVYPCDENGEIFPQFNDPKSPCRQIYQQMCNAAVARMEAAACEIQLEISSQEYSELLRKVKRLQKRRRSRRSR
jgi:hypothetical protein